MWLCPTGLHATLTEQCLCWDAERLVLEAGKAGILAQLCAGEVELHVHSDKASQCDAHK